MTELWQQQHGQKWYPTEAWYQNLPSQPQAACQHPAGRCRMPEPGGGSLLSLEAPAGDSAGGTGGGCKIRVVCFSS